MFTLEASLKFLLLCHHQFTYSFFIGFGLNAARKLRTHRKDQRWADKNYKKRALGTAFKHNPFQGASHAKGIVLEKL